MNEKEILELMTALSVSPDFLSTVYNFPGKKSLMETALFFYSMGYADCIEFNEEKKRVKKTGGFRAYQFKHKPTDCSVHAGTMYDCADAQSNQDEIGLHKCEHRTETSYEMIDGELHSECKKCGELYR